MNKLYEIQVKGKTKDWLFIVEANPKYIQEWRNDGLVIDELLNKIPKWWVDMGFSVRFWCFWQDLLNFNNPFKK